MFTLPSLDGVRHQYSMGGGEQVFARLALEAWPRHAPPAPMPLALQFGQGRIERIALSWRIHEALELRCDQLRIFDVAVTVASNADGVFVILGARSGDVLGSRWSLATRWKQLEAMAPGLAATALSTLTHAGAHSIPLFTPGIAVSYCDFVHWAGCGDERTAINDWGLLEEDGVIGTPTDADYRRIIEERGMITRAQVDKAIPRAVQTPKPLSLARLTELARRRGEVGEVADAVLALRQATTRDCKRKEQPPFESRNDADMVAIAFGATLRWNDRDPALRFFDDYANQESESGGIEECYGWYPCQPGNLPAIIASLKARLELAAKVETVLQLVARRSE